MRLALKPNDPSSSWARCAETGFTQRIPGRTRLLNVQADEGEPRFDALVAVEELPIWLRYRVDERLGDNDPTAYATAFVTSYAAARTDAELQPGVAMGARLDSWGVDGSASAIYPLRWKDRAGCDTEELHALVRGDRLVVVTKRFSSEALMPVRWALFNAAATSAIRWADDADELFGRPLWPPSQLLAPGCVPVLTQRGQVFVEQALEKLGPLPDDLARFKERLHGLAVGGDPPWVVVTDEMRATFVRYLTEWVEREDVVELVRELLSTVHNGHDLRGAAICWLMILFRGGVP